MCTYKMSSKSFYITILKQIKYIALIIWSADFEIKNVSIMFYDPTF